MKPRSSRLIPSTGKLLAAVPAIVCASHAKAQIIYTDVNPDLVGTNVYFTLDGSVIATSIPANYDFQLSVKVALSATGNAQRGDQGIAADFSGHASIFSAGDYIGIGDNFEPGTQSYSVAPSGGPFYLGLAVADANQYNYGWAQVEFSGGSNFTLLDFAYDTTGAGIHAGQTAVIPEPGSTTALAGLVAGSVAAFAALRKRKAAAAA